MFTGIVEGTGKILEIEERPGGRLLRIESGSLTDAMKIGSSVSVSGCCTTVVKRDDHSFSTELMEVTLQKTNLGDVKVGSLVNLERPMKLGDELGGHMVQGHVDGVGTITGVEKLESSHLVHIRVPEDLVKYVVATGSVAANGVSMTVANIAKDILTLGVIPHTWDVTNFSTFETGVRVNLEVDLIGKYIEKLLPDLWSRLALPGTAAERSHTV
jgi:riboflavin synthase